MNLIPAPIVIAVNLRKFVFTAPSFVKSLVFANEDHDPLNLMNLRCDFINYENCNVSREAIHKRFNPEVVAFLKELASKMISSHLKFASQTFTQSCCFNGIYVKDTTKLKLPTIYFNSYPCYGGHNHELSSLMNIQYEYDLLSGNWNRLELTQATQIFDNLMERMVRAQPCPYKHIIAKMTNSIICL